MCFYVFLFVFLYVFWYPLPKLEVVEDGASAFHPQLGWPPRSPTVIGTRRQGRLPWRYWNIDCQIATMLMLHVYYSYHYLLLLLLSFLLFLLLLLLLLSWWLLLLLFFYMYIYIYNVCVPMFACWKPCFEREEQRELPIFAAEIARTFGFFTQQVFREEMGLQPFLATDHELIVPKAWSGGHGPATGLVCFGCFWSEIIIWNE